MADVSMSVADPAVRRRLAGVVDAEGRIARALAALAPIDGRDVVLLDADGGLRQRQLTALGATVTPVVGTSTAGLPDAEADVVVSFWSGFIGRAGETDREVAEAERIARPSGRLLIVHDYGRDDASRVLGDAAREQGLEAWGPRLAWFLANGFKIRVLHCWWTFDSLVEAGELLGAAFGPSGAAVAVGMARPRLSYKVAVFHRTIGEVSADPVSAG